MSITLLNAGRGAGKTYTLVQWAKEDPKRVVVGDDPTFEAMKEAGLSSQYCSYRRANDRFAGYTKLEIAFDDFDTYLRAMLLLEFRLSPTNSVILATSLLEHEGPQKTTPLSGAYAEQLNKLFGGKVTVPSDFLDIAVDALDNLGVFASSLLGEKEKTSEEKFTEGLWRDKGPYTKTVKAKELRIGDVLTGQRGTVTGIAVDVNTIGSEYLTVETKETKSSYGFKGTIRVWAEFEVEIQA